MSNSERKNIMYNRVPVDIMHLLDGVPIDKAIQSLEELEDLYYEEGHNTCVFNVDVYYEDITFYLEIFRKENDQEYEERLAKELVKREKTEQQKRDREAKALRKKLQKEEAGRQEYERIKAEYEKLRIKYE